MPASHSPPFAGTLLAVDRIGKRFSGVPVLEDVSFDVLPGEVHVLAGENGAGKSTLIKIMSGALASDEGQVFVGGAPVRLTSPHDAARRGISVIHQETSLIDSMSVVDNIFLGRERTRNIFWVDRPAQQRRARELAERVGLTDPLETRVGDCTVATKHLIEIAKALAFDARTFIMDEPTSALGDPEVERLLALIKELTADGCGVIYISHRLDEIDRIADRITVLRDGRKIGTERATALPRSGLIHWMIGRELVEQFPARAGTVQRTERPPRLKAERLEVDAVPPVRDLSLTVHGGEIVGIAGLQGSGAWELLRAIFGASAHRVRGSVLIDGRALVPWTPRGAARRGVAFVPGDRKRAALFSDHSVRANITLGCLDRLTWAGVVSSQDEKTVAERQIARLHIRVSSIEQLAGTLSGGNQQKVVLARALESGAEVLLLEEPARGIDIGAKQEIYSLMYRLAASGSAILFVTSDMAELLAMSDRIIVLHRGRPTATFARSTATAEKVLRAAMGAA